MNARILDNTAALRYEASNSAAIGAALRAGDEVTLGGAVKVAGVNWMAACAGDSIGYLPADTKVYRIRRAALAQRADVYSAPDGTGEAADRWNDGEKIEIRGAVRQGEQQWLEVRSNGTGAFYMPAETKVKEATSATATSSLLLVTSERSGARYCGTAVNETLSLIANDILAGALKRTDIVTSKQTGPKGRIAEWRGTVEQFARRHSEIRKLYFPLRAYSRAGMGYGAFIGAGLMLLMDGFTMLQVNELYGLIVLALPVSVVMTAVPAIQKALPEGLRKLAGLAMAALPFVIGLSGLFSFVLGGAVAGGLLFLFPGMAIGAITGAVRRPQLTVAPDAVRESALRICVPIVLTVAVWVAYLALVGRYAPALIPGFVRSFGQ